MAGIMDPLEPETAVVLDDWVITNFENGRQSVLAHQEVTRLKDEVRRLRVALAATSFILEGAIDEAETVHLELGKALEELSRLRPTPLYPAQEFRRPFSEVDGDRTEMPVTHYIGRVVEDSGF